MKELYSAHIKKRIREIDELMEQENFDSLVIESGFPEYYYLDDQTSFFKPNPHFLFFCPDMGEGHILFLEKGKKPKLYYYIPKDFWHETSQLKGEYWEDFFDIEIFDDHSKVWSKIISSSKKQIVISPHPEDANDRGCLIVSEKILSQIHWLRISKTNYEIECIRQANKFAALGHLAARDAFFADQSELGCFNQYLVATQQRQSDMPYGNIVAFDEKTAVLHYQRTRQAGAGQTFLIDAGFRFQGYCSDITRTYFKDGVHTVFKEIHAALDTLQVELCSMVQPGYDYLDIQKRAHEEMSRILRDADILRCSAEEATSKNLVATFFPHGVGHALGLQVHDVGGKQISDLEKSGASEEHPFLRTLRTIQHNDVMTIEPGLYMIPSLLEQWKQDRDSNLINWKLIDQLKPFGGIRIEDNVVASGSTPTNLTREFLPN